MTPHGTDTLPIPRPRPTRRGSHPGSRPRPWIPLGLACVGILFWLKSYLGFVVVDGGSMLPTFRPGDLLLVQKRTYQAHAPARGDIVVSRFRSEFIVKRIVGLPGETVEVVEGGVRVNGSPIPEHHPLRPGALTVRPGELFPDRFALLGDNRSGEDSLLFYAVVPRDAIVGKASLAVRLRWGDLRLWRNG